MDVVDYSPSETYEVGQRIEHPARFGRGVVVELLDDGKMLVFFAEHGERTLVCGRAR